MSLSETEASIVAAIISAAGAVWSSVKAKRSEASEKRMLEHERLLQAKLDLQQRAVDELIKRGELSNEDLRRLADLDLFETFLGRTT